MTDAGNWKDHKYGVGVFYFTIEHFGLDYLEEKSGAMIFVFSYGENYAYEQIFLMRIAVFFPGYTY